MKCIKNKDVHDFYEMNEKTLLENETENNLVIGLANGIKEAKRDSDNPFFYTVCDGVQLFGQCLRTHLDKPLAITHMSEKSIDCLIDKMIEDNISLEGVVGPIDSSTYFSDVWSEKHSLQCSLVMHQGVYELDKVISPDSGGGHLILGTAENQGLIIRFLAGFIKDCFPNDKKIESSVMEMAERHIRNKTLFLWQNREGQIVSMAANNRESRNAATISLVYTPDKLRGNGYASKVVAAISQKMLDQGKKKCNLFTNLANPTSNSIYKKIGYRIISESKHFDFMGISN